MIHTLFTRNTKTRIAWMLFTIMVLQLLSPIAAFALSSGPVQPEVQGFEPVGTTDMVDLFTGDFVYNIPLMDVEGYPVNIAYHGGVTMEQEASWVGLGWNITPGSVNRGLRGLPDDFNGDTVEKEINIKPEITKKIALQTGAELAGVGDPAPMPQLNLGGYLTISNYKGVSVDFTASAGINTNLKFLSAGLNIGTSIGSQSGAAVDYGADVGVGITQSINDGMTVSGSFNANAGGVYSPRLGHRQSVGLSAKLSLSNDTKEGFSNGVTIPIGMQNYTAAVTNASYMNSYSGELKLGGEIYSVYLNGRVGGTISTMKFDVDGSRKGFGYFNLDSAKETDLMDFSREKDGMFNTTMTLLPQTHLTYDVYNVAGQGTGGSFRPFRNDIGSVYDPLTSDTSGDHVLNIEAGLGDLFEIGGEYQQTHTTIESGPWSDYKRPFTGKGLGYYEPVYFKEAGEITQDNESYLNGIGNTAVIRPEDAAAVSLLKPNASTRIVRANHIYKVSGSTDDTVALLDSKKLVSFDDTTGFRNYPTLNKTIIPRVDNGSNKLKRKAQQVTEIVQTQKDGRRYVYGLPILNNVQREATFAINPVNADKEKYLVNYTQGLEDSRSNTNGRDNFYSSTVTPGYVTSHLLTAVLSKDYVDVTGDGVTDDDLGTYTKFNYSRKSADYRWRSPIEPGTAQYIPGYMSDTHDDKASYVLGSREQWMLHSIETRNYVAEFYVSQRQDALGVTDKILSNGAPVYNEAPYNSALNANSSSRYSYKLDSIVLYNKHDRFINGANAQSIKTVLFTYDYSLCNHVPNSVNNAGKLTLKKIQIKFGSSNLNLSAAYSFKYDADHNYDYNIAAKDRWGFYKPNSSSFNNYEFPFTEQSSNTTDYSKAWSLNELDLPSGGIIKVDYESDDYAYVQDKAAMEMFHVVGMGNSPVCDTGGDQLYFSAGQPNLYLYFTRRKTAENNALSFATNYLKDTSTMYYNVPVELKEGLFEPIKGYAQIDEIGKCSDSVHGYVKLSPRQLTGTDVNANPITFTALNLGRYSLPQILYPGDDPDATDMDNIVAGLWNAIGDEFSMHSNPLKSLIKGNKGKNVNLTKAYIRLTSPGLAKKGGGQRVKSIKFYDNWNAMTSGNNAVYGKQYDYTMQREDGKGVISSGVASYEPLIGGDELPQRMPAVDVVQAGSNVPPNDPVELYQEWPIGETFYPSPVVGYRQVSVKSINVDSGRSSQSLDVSGFYTAKDFPVVTAQSSIIADQKPHKDITLTYMKFTQQATQGFSIVLNDMHGKPKFTQHWVLKPAAGTGARELVNSQQFDYITQNGQLDNMVPAFSYNGGAGQLGAANRKMGVETDITIDSRMRHQQSDMWQVSGNLNGFAIAVLPIAIPLIYPFSYGTQMDFKCATVTKVTQQYGILSQVTNNNEGAITTVKNEVFDAQTGNALVTSVNNQFNDKEYTATYPAYWAYKELGPSYENHDLNSYFHNSVIIDSFGAYAARFVNYNPAYSSHYDLPSNMPVARVVVDEAMPNYKLGDEMMLYPVNGAQPVKVWAMGFTSDTSHCYLVMTTREPYKQDAVWHLGATYPHLQYRVVRSGNRNQLGETIQSFTTKDASNIFPYLKNDLTNLTTLNATRYNHNLSQVFAANQVSDSLNPFVTGKVGIYRPEKQVVNLKPRNYNVSTARNAGLYNSSAYWKVEKDSFAAYCPDERICEGHFILDTVIYHPAGSIPKYPNCHALDSLSLTYLGGDSILVVCNALSASPMGTSFTFLGWDAGSAMQLYNPSWLNWTGFGMYTGTNNPNPNFPFPAPTSYRGLAGSNSFVIHDKMLIELGVDYFHANATTIYSLVLSGYDVGEIVDFSSGLGGGVCELWITYLGNGQFRIERPGYVLAGTNLPAQFINVYHSDAIECNGTINYPAGYDTFRNACFGPSFPSPYRVRNKILLGKVGHYDNDPNDDDENWVNTQQVTKYNWHGEEVENYDQGIGYNAAIYGYNQQLPICVTKNARHNDVLFDGFEDYAVLNPKPSANESYVPLFYSPFAPFMQTFNALGSSYKTSTLSSSSPSFIITSEDAHTGNYCAKVADEDATIPLNAAGTGMADGYSFRMKGNRKYVASLWLKPIAAAGNVVLQGYSGSATIQMDTLANGAATGAATTVTLVPKSNIIEGWQQYEVTFNAPKAYKYFTLNLRSGFYYDDIRLYPFESNSKGFVYHPVTRKLMATLDENNYATFYEYDAEGNLVRTKKETEKGVLTVIEARNTHFKGH